MTRKDYFLIAKAIKTAFPTDFDAIGNRRIGTPKRALLRELIPALKADNPNFQSFRFLLACDAEDLWDDKERRYVA